MIRLGEYSDLRRQARCSSAYFADLEQAAVRGTSIPGTSLPCLLTHGTIHCWSPNRWVTPAELYLMHGFNRRPAHTKRPVPCRLNSFLSGLNAKDAKQLLGNGWHLPTLASFFFLHPFALRQLGPDQPDVLQAREELAREGRK